MIFNVVTIAIFKALNIVLKWQLEYFFTVKIHIFHWSCSCVEGLTDHYRPLTDFVGCLWWRKTTCLRSWWRCIQYEWIEKRKMLHLYDQNRNFHLIPHHMVWRLFQTWCHPGYRTNRHRWCDWWRLQVEIG